MSLMWPKPKLNKATTDFITMDIVENYYLQDKINKTQC